MYISSIMNESIRKLILEVYHIFIILNWFTAVEKRNKTHEGFMAGDVENDPIRKYFLSKRTDAKRRARDRKLVLH